MSTTIDEQFIRRVYTSSAYLWGFGFLVCWAVSGLGAAGGWTLGSALSIGILRSLEWIIRRSFVPGAPNARRALTRFSLLKLPMVLLVLMLAIWTAKSSFAFIVAFCAGVVLTQSVIFLKVLGTLVVERLNG